MFQLAGHGRDKEVSNNIGKQGDGKKPIHSVPYRSFTSPQKNSIISTPVSCTLFEYCEPIIDVYIGSHIEDKVFNPYSNLVQP